MRCNMKKILMLCFLTLSSFLQAVEIYIAPFVMVSEDHLLEITKEEKGLDKLFYQSVLSTDEEHLLDIRLLLKTDLIKNREIKSILNAGELCEKYNIDFLVYGFYKKTYQYCEAEIRVFELSTKENRKVFYSKAEYGEIIMMKDELAGKLVSYFYDLLGVDEQARKKIPTKSFGGIELYGSTGYWTPAAGWFEIVSGIATAEAGVFIQPDDILFYNPDWLMLFRYGFTVGYLLGLNKPDIEDSSLHSVQLELPLRLCVLFLSRHMINTGISVFYRHDFVYQIRLFGTPVWSNSGTLGISGVLGYEYWCGDVKRYAFGGLLKLDLAFYKHPETRFRFLFTYQYRLDFGGNGKSANIKEDAHDYYESTECAANTSNNYDGNNSEDTMEE